MHSGKKYTTKELGELFGIDPRTVQRQIKNGDMKVKAAGRGQYELLSDSPELRAQQEALEEQGTNESTFLGALMKRLREVENQIDTIQRELAPLKEQSAQLANRKVRIRHAVRLMPPPGDQDQREGETQ